MNDKILIIGAFIIYSISLMLFALFYASAYALDKCDNDYHMKLINGIEVVCYVSN